MTNNLISEGRYSDALIDDLLKEGDLTKQEVEIVKQYAKLNNVSIFEAISILGYVDEHSLLLRITKNMKGVFKDIFVFRRDFNSDNEKNVKFFKFNLENNVSKTREQCLFDVNKESKTVCIATPNLNDHVGRMKASSFYEDVGWKCNFYICSGMDFSLLRDRIYKLHAQSSFRVFNLFTSSDDGAYGNQAEMGMDDILSAIVETAVIDNASDVYLDFRKKGVSFLFYRIDRQKHPISIIPEEHAVRLVQYIKQVSGMDAGKLKGHQDGAIQIPILSGRYIISARVSWITTVSGGHFTIRLQDEEKKNLLDLGFTQSHVEEVIRILRQKKGIIILSGVTGSGKTTTLYSMLDFFNPNHHNIITMEDPVEIVRYGVNQVEINDLAGQSFSSTIRASLRQAPDIILLGEIRDTETAQRAVEAALTGHLVLTTVHAPNVSPGLRFRLQELGVENIDMLLRSTTLAIYQELIPKKEGGLRLAYEFSTNVWEDLPKVDRVGFESENAN